MLWTKFFTGQGSRDLVVNTTYRTLQLSIKVVEIVPLPVLITGVCYDSFSLQYYLHCFVAEISIQRKNSRVVPTARHLNHEYAVSETLTVLGTELMNLCYSPMHGPFNILNCVAAGS